MKVSFLQNNFLQKLSVYTISSYINKAIPFLMLPILTNYLSTDEYGEVSMFLALINLLVAVFGLSIEGALMRKFYDKGESFPAVLFNYLFLLISSFSVCSVLFVIFSSEIATYSGVSVQYLAAAVLSSFFSVACYCVNSLHQVEGKAAAYAIFTNGWSFLNTLLSIILVVFFSLGVAGRVYGIAISTILMGIVGILLLCKMVLYYR
ncbi:lipopolysaccharide biosynthesis protein [Bacteroides hominis]|uniref:lipopolysaccharide biosynthesis protein n=1 Tax=Bacteroides hominis TaxID=2763023 RepID=UPI00229C1268|nr:oligosaccharide flippase family protein [Bacteroides fragilis]